jgi:hypothetical protein
MVGDQGHPYARSFIYCNNSVFDLALASTLFPVSSATVERSKNGTKSYGTSSGPSPLLGHVNSSADGLNLDL